MRRFVLITLVLLVAASAFAQEKKEESKPVNYDFAWARSPYRLEFTIKELDDGKVVNSRIYSMVLMSSERQGRGYSEVKAGSRVPVVTTNKEGQPTTTYMDVGVTMWARLYALDSGNLLLEAGADISSLASTQTMSNPIVRAIHSSTFSEINSGKPTQIAMVDDPTSNHRFQIEVTATKLQ